MQSTLPKIQMNLASAPPPSAPARPRCGSVHLYAALAARVPASPTFFATFFGGFGFGFGAVIKTTAGFGDGGKAGTAIVYDDLLRLGLLHLRPRRDLRRRIGGSDRQGGKLDHHRRWRLSNGSVRLQIEEPKRDCCMDEDDRGARDHPAPQRRLFGGGQNRFGDSHGFSPTGLVSVGFGATGLISLAERAGSTGVAEPPSGPASKATSPIFK